MDIIQIEHHGRQVFVNKELQGKHRQHCLCYNCGRWPDGQAHPDCQIAKKLYEFSIEYGTVTPVYECPGWIIKADNSVAKREQ